MPLGEEQFIGVIGNARKMKMLGASWDTYALVVTNHRMIFAQLTADMLNAAYKEAAERVKAEDTGFLGQMAHQMTVQSADGKFEFHIGEDDRFINILKAAYGEKVHMPFGYFKTGGVRIKLF